LASGSRGKDDVRGPGDAILAKKSLQDHILILATLELAAKARIVPQFGLLLLITTVPWLMDDVVSI
jgi:hypothetical protein